MLSNNLLSKTLKTVSIWAISGVLLGSAFSSSTWAMERPSDEDCYIGKTQSSFFKYDFKHLNDARQVINQANFLSEEGRSFFEQSVKTYDRTQFLQYLDLEKKNTFLATIESLDEFKFPLTEEILAQMADAGVPIPDETLENLKTMHRASMHSIINKRYGPYFNNIENDILEKGPLNYALFDAFIHHLWQSCEADEQEHYTIKESPYPQEGVYTLLLDLEKVGFLKNFKMESLSNVEETYGPLEELRFFQKNSKEAVTDLVLAGGHIGRKKMESISRYKNSLMIDLNPFQVPDVIADINDTKLLSVLLEHYESHFNVINDAFNTFTFGSGYKPETVEALVRMLKPRGRLMCASSESSECPDDYDMSTNDYTQNLIKKCDLIPVYSNKNQGTIIALEKK